MLELQSDALLVLERQVIELDRRPPAVCPFDFGLETEAGRHLDDLLFDGTGEP
ncbi:MAG: hypothetical protein H6722_35020, partial [Sandaracinus sp.]|nr:hypothetical protein [Sandaracinus sp.]